MLREVNVLRRCMEAKACRLSKAYALPKGILRNQLSKLSPPLGLS